MLIGKFGEKGVGCLAKGSLSGSSQEDYIIITVIIYFLSFRTRLRKISSESRKRKADEKSENTPLQCSFGEFMESTCPCNPKPSLPKLGEEEQTIFKMRAGIMLFDESVVNTCRNHQLHLGEYFEKK